MLRDPPCSPRECSKWPSRLGCTAGVQPTGLPRSLMLEVAIWSRMSRSYRHGGAIRAPGRNYLPSLSFKATI
eukprot:7113022-Pyramimonas_sp.AAC.1